MKNKKTNYTVIALLILLLAIGLAYASFTGLLTVSGTAETTTCKVDFVTGSVLGDLAGQTSITSQNQTLTLGNIVLEYPGDKQVITATIKNVGKVDAVVDEEFNISTTGGADKDAVKVTVTTTPNQGADLEQFKPDEEATVEIEVEWLETAIGGVSGTVGISATTNYVQYTTP